MLRYSPRTVKGFPPKAVAAHGPGAADAEVGVHLFGLEAAFGSPPLDAFLRIGEGVEDSSGGGADDDFLDDFVAGGIGSVLSVHAFSSTYFLRLARLWFQNSW